MRSAARTARSASSSCATGTPNTAITASPMNFSTVPPYASAHRGERDVDVAQEVAQLLGVHLRRELGRARQVGEDDRGELSLGRVAAAQRTAAAGAETGALRCDRAAGGATGRQTETPAGLGRSSIALSAR